MSNSAFSLRMLPDNVRLQVIKSFDYVELIAFALISRKSKALVQSFKLQIDNFLVSNVGQILQFSITFKGFDQYHDFQIYHARGAHVELVSLNMITNIIRVVEQNNPPSLTWRTPDLSFVGWFEHLLSLFKFNNTEFCVRSDQEIYDTEEIRNLLSEWTSVNVRTTCPRYYQKISDFFSPCVKNFESYAHQNYPTFPQKIGIQNFDNFESSYPLNLDDLLSLNAIDSSIFNISISNLNRFVKAWMRGSNPRMQFIHIFVNEVMDETKLLKGIQHKITPVGVERMTRDGRVVKGNIDVRNNKGIVATIKVYEYHFGIDMIVWN